MGWHFKYYKPVRNWGRSIILLLSKFDDTEESLFSYYNTFAKIAIFVILFSSKFNDNEERFCKCFKAVVNKEISSISFF